MITKHIKSLNQSKSLQNHNHSVGPEISSHKSNGNDIWLKCISTVLILFLIWLCWFLFGSDRKIIKDNNEFKQKWIQDSIAFELKPKYITTIERTYLDGYKDTLIVSNNPKDNQFYIEAFRGNYFFCDTYNNYRTPAVIRFQILSNVKESNKNEQ